MFNFVHENKKIIQIVLALVVLPFAFWGIDSYRRNASADALATVNGEKIAPAEFDNAMRQQENRMREMMGDKFDPSMMEQPEAKRAVLDNLINQKLLVQQSLEQGLVVSDSQLAQIISQIPSFQKDGKFDQGLYESVLHGQNMTPKLFESRVRQDLVVRQMSDSFNSNGYASGAVIDKLIQINEQQRMVSVYRLSEDAYLDRVKLGDGEVAKYYESNTAEFQMPEQAKVEYVIFSADSLLPQIKVDPAEISQYYQDHQPEFGTQEQRQASHILISTPSGASDADKKAAREKAEDVLRQVRESPDKFAELAKKYSQDAGSAASGGDLGMFTRGMMVKPFEDAVFKLKPGEISDVVESDFGFHVIKLTSILPAKIKPLDDVKEEIERKLKQQKAVDEFNNLADKFNNTVYEQSDSLQPAAALVGAKVQQSPWLDNGKPAASPWSDKALQAIFTDDVIKQKRNSAVVEIGDNELLSARLLEYKPASTKPLSEVRESIRQKLQKQKAAELAASEGQAILAKLQHGENPKLGWNKEQVISRAQPTDIGKAAAQLVFQADVSKLPAYVGADDAGKGYMLIRINSIKEGEGADDAKRKRYAQELRKLTGDEMFEAYLADARKQAKVEINDEKLDALK